MKKTNEHAIISMHKSYKINLSLWSSIFIIMLYMSATKILGINKNISCKIIMAVLAAAALISFIRWVYFAAAFKTEKDDELSKENMLKAQSSISSIFLFTAAVTVLLSYMIDINFTIKVNHNTLVTFWLIVYSGYNSLRSGLFLIYDKTDILGKSADE